MFTDRIRFYRGHTGIIVVVELRINNLQEYYEHQYGFIVYYINLRI